MILHDLAAPILRNAPELGQDLRADLFDAFHDSKTAEHLAQNLANIPISDSLKRQLITARAKSLQPDSKTPIVDKAVEAFDALPKNVLDMSERHSVVAKLVVDAHLKS